MNTSDIQRFFKKVEIDESTGCWLWTGGKFKEGYGSFYLGDSCVLAHRLMYSQIYGEIVTKKLLVCHSCDVKHCVNPGHMFLGTAQDNATDYKNKLKDPNSTYNKKLST